MTAWRRGAGEPCAGRWQGWQALALAALVNGLLFGLFFALATPGYETNDDLGMQLIASGFFTGEPSAHLIFTHVLIGWVLRGLYGISGAFNWYFLYLVTVHYVSLTALAFVILSRARRWSFAALYVGFFLLVEIRILVNLQFTTTAFLAGAAGVLLLVHGLEPGRPTRWPDVIAGITLITLMGMIRVQVAPFTAVVSFPFLLERFGLRGWRRLSAAAVTCGLLFLVMDSVNRWWYERDAGWAWFLDYNELRGQVQDTPLVRFMNHAAPAADWSQNDAQMFGSFYFSEPAVYGDIGRMRRFVEALKDYDPPESMRRAFSWDWLYLPNHLRRDAASLMNLALLSGVWCLWAAGRRRLRYGITLAAMYVIFVLVSFWLWHSLRLPSRVTYNVPLFVLLACLYWATDFHRASGVSRPGSASTASSSGWWRAGVGVWFLLVVHFGFNLAQISWYMNLHHRRQEKISRRVFEPIKMLPTDGGKPILVCMPPDSTLRDSLVYRHSVTDAPFYLVPNGCRTHSPLFNRVLQEHGLEPYSLSMVDRRDVFFVMGQEWPEPLRTFYLEHYGLPIRFEQVLNTDDMPRYRDCHLAVYRLHSDGNETASKAAP